MMRPSGMVRPTPVTLTRNVWGQDADGGKVVTGTVTLAETLCSVQQDPAQRVVGEDGRLSTLIPTTLRFSDSLDLRVDDVATWAENGVVHSIQIEGRINRMGRDATFEYSGVERV